MPVIGIDIGTQSLKAIVAGDALEILGEGAVPYAPQFPRPGWAEQDPRLWLEALKPAIGVALARARLKPGDIQGLALAGQLDGCLPSAAGHALGPCIIWMDRRAEKLISDVPPELVRDRAGLARDPTHMAAKIRWWEQELGGAEVELWHQPVSFLLEALTGARLMDPALASTTMLYGLECRGWDRALLDAFDLGAARLPGIAAAETVAGALHSAGSALTGLPQGLPVAVGTGDDFSNLLGGGLFREGTVAAALGTAEVVGALCDRPVVDPELLVETHPFFGGRHALVNPGWLSGGAITWFLKTFGVESPAALSALAAEAPPGSEGLLFLPALSGAMAPRWVAGARGAFYGLTPAHGRAHCARAVLEGTAFAMLDVIERLEALGVPAKRLRLMGGGARSAVWAQIRADLTGLPTEVCAMADASPVGAAVLASVAAGLHRDVAAALSVMRTPYSVVEPDLAKGDVYRAAHARYRRLFEALTPLYG
ncbi:MAG: FGGY-family carbohydrate kinase [Parvibaculaceae bacterium]